MKQCLNSLQQLIAPEVLPQTRPQQMAVEINQLMRAELRRKRLTVDSNRRNLQLTEARRSPQHLAVIWKVVTEQMSDIVYLPILNTLNSNFGF